MERGRSVPTLEQFNEAGEKLFVGTEFAYDVITAELFRLISKLDNEPYATVFAQLKDAKRVGELGDALERAKKANSDISRILMQLKKYMESTEDTEG